MIHRLNERRRRQEQELAMIQGPPPNPQMSYQAFMGQHAVDGPPMPVPARDGYASKTKLLPDGAAVACDSFGASCRNPSDNPIECLQTKIKYWELRAEQGEQDFHALKAALEGFGKPFRWSENGAAERYRVANPGSGEDALEVISKAVWQARDKIMSLTAELEKHPEIQRQRQAEEIKAREQHEIEALQQRAEHDRRQRISAITI
jgi:hypothetical protein